MSNDHQDQGVSNDLEKRTTMSEKTPTDHPADETAVRDLYHQLMDG